MKKSLSLLLAFALVLSMFSTLALANEDLTTLQKFELLKEEGIFAGINGEAALDQEMTRAQAARIGALLLGKDPDSLTVTEKPYDDVAVDAWYAEEITVVKEEGLFEGYGDGTFGPNDSFTIEQLAVVTAKVLGLDPVEGAEVDGAANWAAGYVQALLDNNVAFPTNYTDNATRGNLVDASFEAAVHLGLVEVEAGEQAVSAVQTGAKKITVNFARAVADAEKADLEFDVKYGSVPYQSEAEWADDNKSVVLEFNFLPEGDYTITVGDFDAVTVKVEAAKVAAVEIGAESLQVADGQNLGVKAINQFGETMTAELSTGNISVYNATYAKNIIPYQDGDDFKVDMSALARVDDSVIVTVTHPNTGLSASKTFKVVDASTITSMSFGPVKPLEDKTRITIGDEDLEVPYNLVDQYGNKITLADKAASNVHGDLQFMSSNSQVIDPNNFKVDDGKLIITKVGKYMDGGTEKEAHGNVIITVLNAKAGVSTNFSVNVEENAKVKSFNISHPGVLVAANDDLVIPFSATDSTGAPMAQADFKDASVHDQVTFNAVGANNAVNESFDRKTGELKFKLANKGSTTVYVLVGGVITSQITLDVKDEAEPTKVTGIKNVNTLFAAGGTFELKFNDHINAVDQYGRALKDQAITVTVKDGSTDVVTVAGTTITGVAEGSKKIVVELTGVAESAYEFDVKVIKDDDIKGFELEAMPTLYADDNAAGSYTKDVSLVGKDANGNRVNIAQSNYIDVVTSSNEGVAKITGTETVYGIDKGTTIIAVWRGAEKLDEIEVTVSDAAPSAAEAKFDEGSIDVDEGDTVAEGTDFNLEVKDQYGVDISGTVSGVWTTSDSSVATVSASGVITGVKEGDAVISFVTTNGVIASIEVTVLK